MGSATLFLIAALLPFASAQDGITADEVLRRVAEKYTNAESYHTVMVMRSTTKHRNGEITEQEPIGFEIAMAKPNKLRFLGVPGKYLEPMTVVSDGTNAWLHFPKRKQYMKLKPGDASARELTEGDVKDDTVIHWARQEAQKALGQFGAPVKGATIVREEVYDGVDCYVIRIENGPSAKYRCVDKRRFVVLREDEISDSGSFTESSSVVFSGVTVNRPLPDSLFTFVPPEGARLVDRISQ